MLTNGRGGILVILIKSLETLSMQLPEHKPFVCDQISRKTIWGWRKTIISKNFRIQAAGGMLLVMVICIIISVEKTMRVSLWDPHENVVLACDALHNVVKLSHNCQLYRLLMLLWDVFSIYLTGLCCTLVTSTFIFHFLT